MPQVWCWPPSHQSSGFWEEGGDLSEGGKRIDRETQTIASTVRMTLTAIPMIQKPPNSFICSASSGLWAVSYLF